MGVPAPESYVGLWGTRTQTDGTGAMAAWFKAVAVVVVDADADNNVDDVKVVLIVVVFVVVVVLVVDCIVVDVVVLATHTLYDMILYMYINIWNVVCTCACSVRAGVCGFLVVLVLSKSCQNCQEIG